MNGLKKTRLDISKCETILVLWLLSPMTSMVKVSSLEAVVWRSVVRRIKQVGTICITFN